jgi:hypothetical protein
MTHSPNKSGSGEEKLMKKLGTAAVFAAAMFAAVGTATANATDPSGTYNVVFDHRTGYADDTYRWTLTPCGQGCLHVTGDYGLQGDFHLIHGQWTLTQQNVPNSVQCKDGSRHDGDMTLMFDPTSLRGKSTGYDHIGCPLGVPGPTNPISFTLEKA